MLIACLLVPSLALACELAERPQLAGRPVALVDVSRTRVVDCTVEARRYSVRAGMPLREATALCPALVVLEERPARAARAAEVLVDAVASVSPIVEEAAPGVVYAGLRGLEGLYPRRGMVEQAILAAAPAALQPRLGVAATRFTAYVAARGVSPGAAQRVEADEAAEFLAGRPAAWLPLAAEDVERLRLFGIETIGNPSTSAERVQSRTLYCILGWNRLERS